MFDTGYGYSGYSDIVEVIYFIPPKGYLYTCQQSSNQEQPQ